MSGRIVVGVDGPDGSVTALRCALEEALRRGATVEVVHSWQYPYMGGHPLFVAYGVTHEALKEAGQAMLE